MFPEKRPFFTILIALILGAGSIAYLGKGVEAAWRGGDSDYRMRQQEWNNFEQGVYPNRRHTPSGKSQATRHSVYPPYALMMFGPFLSGDDFSRSRSLLEIFSMAGLASMMALGWLELRGMGWSAGFLGLALGPAISGNCTAFALGQFSIISSGLIAAQIMAIGSRRRYLAGILWAFAMIKPQMALPFALLFLIGRQEAGLAAGACLLVGLSFAALRWTGWSVGEYLVHGIGSESFSFIKDVKSWPLGSLAVPPWAIVFLGVGLIIVLGVGLCFKAGNVPTRWLLPLSGGAAMLGYVLFYHRHYDNQMLFPLMLAATVSSLHTRHPAVVGTTMLMGLSLYLPPSMIVRNHVWAVVAFASPVMTAAALLLPRAGWTDSPDKENGPA